MTDRTIHASSTELASFRVFSDGQEIPGQFAVHSIMTSRKYNAIPVARLVLLDGSIADEDFTASNEDTFAPGKEIEIKLGYHGDEETVFKGIVIKHGLRTRDAEQSLLELEIRHEAIKLTVNRANRYFESMSDGDVIEEICNSQGLAVSVDAIAETHAEMIQYYTTDWDFLVTRAESNGMLVLATDDELKISQPAIAGSGVLDLVYGQNVLEFETSMDARHQYAAITTKAWDFVNQELIEGEGSANGFTEAGNISSGDLAGVLGIEAFDLRHSGQLSNTELQSWADATMYRSKLSKIQGRLRIIGFSGIQPGDTVELGGMGDRFNGLALVAGVQHVMGTESMWYTDLQIGFPRDWLVDRFDNVQARPASGLIAGIDGLMIGKVSGLEDPDGEDRVQVRLPVLDDQSAGIWARVSAPDAGDGRGVFFRPEIEDEVIVGFIQNDPRDAVILGMLNSSAKPAPITADDSNPQKGIVTRSEMKLLFDDDKVCITIETPNGNIITVSDDSGAIQIEDENRNKIVMDSSGILCESAGDIVMKASGNVSIEGTNIDISANGSLKAEGSGSSELSSSATTTVKGSLVQIN